VTSEIIKTLFDMLGFLVIGEILIGTGCVCVLIVLFSIENRIEKLEKLLEKRSPDRKESE